MLALRLAAVLAVSLALLVPAAAQAQLSLPPGFEERPLVTGLWMPTAMAWAPDGRMFITEKRGVVRVVSALGILQGAPLIDLQDQVNDSGDRGLLGIAVDAQFAANGYLYVLHTYEHDAADYGGPKTSRLTRLTLSGNTVVAQKVLLGKDSGPGCPHLDNGTDCLPSEGYSHSIGTVRAAPDGTLWVGSGDAASFSEVDPLAFRTSDERSMAGKILHIDREGNGLPGNPYCRSNPRTDVCAKVFARGFRNPFRFVLRDGLPLVGDVGWGVMEELSHVQPGQDYGWPCYEGTRRTGGYAERPECEAVYAREGKWDAKAPPFYAYPHTGGGASVQAAPQYTGTEYPAGYHGAWFVADYNSRWIKRYSLDAQGRMAGEPVAFAENYGGVQIETAANGDLVWVDIENGAINQVSYTAGNRAPVAKAGASPSSGAAPLATTLSAAGSSDPDGDPLAYDWDFGDGSPHSSQANPSHTYASVGSYTARLTVSDGRGRTAASTVAISAGNTPPVPAILSPGDEGRFRAGATVALSGTATDPQEGTLPASALTWRLKLHHNEHVHPDRDLTGRTPAFRAADDHDASSYYEVALTATDAGGLTATRTIRLRPEVVDLRFASEPAGATLSYSGVEFGAPLARSAAAGYKTSISAEPEFAKDGKHWLFDRWSDGGARLHNVTVPNAAATYTAIYRENAAPIARATASPASGPAPLAVAFDGSASTDPDAHAITYAWDLDGNGTTDSTAAKPSHTFARPGNRAARLTVTDDRGRSGTTTVAVAVTNTPPVPSITAGPVVSAGERLALTGGATDAQDGPLAGTALRWRIVQIRGATATERSTATGADAALDARPDHDPGDRYEATLTATDADGGSASRTVVVRPRTVRVTVASTPAGVPLSANGTVASAPVTVATGTPLALAGPGEHAADGALHRFDAWSHGAAREHTLLAPAQDTTYTATYRLPDPPVRTQPVPAPEPEPLPSPPSAPLPLPLPVLVPVAPDPVAPPAGEGDVLDAPPTTRPQPRAVRFTFDQPWKGRRPRPVRAFTGRFTVRSGALRVRVAISRPWRRSRTHCQFWDPARARFGSPIRCAGPAYFAARVTRAGSAGRWRASLGGPLAYGRYRILLRAVDATGATVPSTVRG